MIFLLNLLSLNISFSTSKSSSFSTSSSSTSSSPHHPQYHHPAPHHPQHHHPQRQHPQRYRIPPPPPPPQHYHIKGLRPCRRPRRRKRWTQVSGGFCEGALSKQFPASAVAAGHGSKSGCRTGKHHGGKGNLRSPTYFEETPGRSPRRLNKNPGVDESKYAPKLRQKTA